MKKIIISAAALLVAGAAFAQGERDWAGFGKYAGANAALTTPPDVVFIGDSVIEGWAAAHPSFFASGNYAGRGIGGQVTAQMLTRFRADVIALNPRVVVILAGTNDIARGEGWVSIPNIAGNILSMGELARTYRIRVVVCSVLPAAAYPWNPGVSDAAVNVLRLNTRLADLARDNGFAYVDFWNEMADESGGLPKEFSEDGIHPTDRGYTRMEQILAPVLNKILRRK